MRRFVIGVLVGVLATAASHATANPLPDGWSTLPGTALRPLVPSFPDSGNPEGFLIAWIGGAFDTRRYRWIIPLGGGHGDYGGNQSLAVSLVTRARIELLARSPSAVSGAVTPVCSGIAEEADPGRPAARHTYDAAEYDPVRDAVWVFGQTSIACQGGNGTNVVWRLDLSTLTWTRYNPPGGGGTTYALIGAGPVFSGVQGVTSAWDPVTESIYVHNRNRMYRFRVRDATFIQVGADHGVQDNVTMAIDPWRRKAVLLGETEHNGIHIFDLATNTWSDPVTSGSNPQTAAAPGLAYWPRTGEMVAWSGGTTLYRLNLDTLAWTSETPPGPGPVSPVVNGVFGKFQYAPNLGCFVVAVDIDDDLSTVCPSGASRIGGRVAIPLQTFYFWDRGDKGEAPAEAMKHNTYTFNPLDGRHYQHGGDYTEYPASCGYSIAGCSGGANWSYMQSMYSVDLRTRLQARSTDTAGWIREQPLCAGGGVQPKMPDFAGLQFDPRTRQFWLAGGLYDINTEPEVLCPGETSNTSSDPLYQRGGVFRWNWAQAPGPNRWTSVTTVHGCVAGDQNWMTILDPRPGSGRLWCPQGETGGGVMQYFDIATSAWVTGPGIPSNALGQSIRIWKEQLTLDPHGVGTTSPAIYAIDGVAGRLIRFRLGTFDNSFATGFDDLGPVPGGQIGGGTTFNDAYVTWDAVNRRLLFFRFGSDAEARKIHAYNPETQTWSTGGTAMDVGPTSPLYPNVRHAFNFDPYQNLAYGIGSTDGDVGTREAAWVYRWADGESTDTPSDTTPPSVSLTAPTAGATVSGTITVSATASDDVGVVGVQFRLDGTNLGAEDTTSPYSISWNTVTALNGPHTLTAVARDAAGNSTTSAGVTVTVNNPVTGPVAAWAFNEGVGTTSSDATGNGHTATLLNGAQLSLCGGHTAGALLCDGVNDYAEVAHTAFLAMTSGLTVMAWVYPISQQTGFHGVVFKHQSTAPNLPTWDMLHTTNPSPPQAPGAEVIIAGSSKVAKSGLALPVGQWSHLAFTWDGANIRLWVNAVNVATTAAAGSLSPTTLPLQICGSTIFGEFGHIRVDDLRIYGRPLSQTELAADMNRPVTVTNP